MRTKLYVLGIVTVGGILVLLLLSMPRLRWWIRPEPGRRAVAPAVPQPAASPALASAVAGPSRPAAGVPVPPDHVGYLSSPTRPSPVPPAAAPWPAPGPPESGRPSRTPPAPGRPDPAGPAGGIERPAAGHAGNGHVPGSTGNGYLPGNGYPAGRDEDAVRGTPPGDDAPPWLSGRPGAG